MPLEERTVVDLLEVQRDGTVQVREAIEILRDGEVIATQYHRYVVAIDDDNPDLSHLDAPALAVVNAARTPERQDASLARRKERDPGTGNAP